MPSKRLNKTSGGLLGGLIGALVLAVVFIVLYAVRAKKECAAGRTAAVHASMAASHALVRDARSVPTADNYVRALFGEDDAYAGCLTVSHSYYGTPAALARVLEHYAALATTAPDAAARIVVQIVDDGTPPSAGVALPVVQEAVATGGLQAFRGVRVVTLAHDVGFNNTGARNTGALVAPTTVVALFDLSRPLPASPSDLDALFKSATSLHTQLPHHLFQVAASDAALLAAPNQHLVHRGFYLHTGGADEDFSAGYKHDTAHFLHRFVTVNGGVVVPLRLASLPAFPSASPSATMPMDTLDALKGKNAALMQHKIAHHASPSSLARVPWVAVDLDLTSPPAARDAP